MIAGPKKEIANGENIAGESENKYIQMAPNAIRIIPAARKATFLLTFQPRER